MGLEAKELGEMYRKMVAIRSFERAVLGLVAKAQLPWSHLYIGQEAIAVGACAALRPTDYVVSTHRGHGHLIAKGCSTKRMMAEIAGRRTGYCKGKGGTMHIANPEKGVLGAISIVGAGIPIALGAGLSTRLLCQERVTVCFFGEGAANQGAFHEGVNMAALWKLPIVFICENNLYAMYTRQSRTMSIANVADRAAAYGIPGVIVDGNDVVAVYTAVNRAVNRARRGKGPTLIECKTYRKFGHSTSDPGTAYRSQEEVKAWEERDPVARLRKYLLGNGMIDEKELISIENKQASESEAALEYALHSPFPDGDELFKDVFAPAYEAEVTAAGQAARELTYREAIREALIEEMRQDSRVFLLGEDIGVGGGAFGVTKGLLDEFGEERIIDTPISENGYVGAAIGAAITGTRPIAEVMFVDLMALCMDQVVNLAAKIRYMTGAQVQVPLVIRTAMGGGVLASATHSQSLEAWFYHVPGLKVVVPSSPYDAKGLLKTSIREDNPVLFLEHKRLYNVKGSVPSEEYVIPLGKADVKRRGTDVTLIVTSFMVTVALSVANRLEKEGVDVEVIDLRTLVPLDKETILASVKKTGKVVILEEACKQGSVGADISSMIVEEVFDYLDAPIERIGAPRVPIPFSSTLESHYIPSEEDLIRDIKALL